MRADGPDTSGKVIPYFAKEQAGINLMFAVLITHAKKWRGIKVNPEIQLQWVTMREKLYKVASPKPIIQKSLEEVMDMEHPDSIGKAA